MRKLLIALAVAGSFSPAAFAFDLDRMQLASRLASVIAAEKFCGLTYDQDAIAGFIDKKVAADDLGFAPELQNYITLEGFSQDKMTASAKTAHCRQIARVAVSYGFVKK